MNFDYAIHSDFLIYWTGKDIDAAHDSDWYESDRSNTPKGHPAIPLYIERLRNILKFGLWMTEEEPSEWQFGGIRISVPSIPQACFTELKLSESRKHAKQYGRLGIGVKRPFVFTRLGRPLVYYGFGQELTNDIFLKACATELKDRNLLAFFKPMNSTKTLNYDYYAESEWRIIYFEELLRRRLIVDPRDAKNVEQHTYFQSLLPTEQAKLKYLIPLDGWLAMIIYPSLTVKNLAQQDETTGVRKVIEGIKQNPNDHGNRVEGNNWPIEMNLDSCRNF